MRGKFYVELYFVFVFTDNENERSMWVPSSRFTCDEIQTV